MSQDQALNNIATEFFRIFSRTEYALKASGCHKGDGEAKADWNKFARKIEDSIATPTDQKLGEAIRLILDKPPKKQMIAGGIIEWQSVEPETNSKADLVFQYIRRIRNNLFHGGKFNGHWFAPERSEKLLRAALVVLEASVEVDPDVREAYYG